MINVKELKAVITTAKKYCRKGNTTIPALNKVLVSLSGNRLTIRSTDLTTWYQRTIDIDNVALKDLRFIVDASHLLKILNSIKESININVIDNVLHIYTDTLELASVDVSDAENYLAKELNHATNFPNIPKHSQTKCLNLCLYFHLSNNFFYFAL